MATPCASAHVLEKFVQSLTGLSIRKDVIRLLEGRKLVCSCRVVGIFVRMLEQGNLAVGLRSVFAGKQKPGQSGGVATGR